MATQWAPGSLHPKGKIRVSPFNYVHLVGVSKYGHYSAQAQESLLESGAPNKASLILGK